RIREILGGFLEKVFAEEKDIELLAISTTEGMNISHVASEGVSLAAPRLANLAGSVMGLGKDLTKNVLRQNPGTMCLETEGGNVCLVHTTFANYPCILTIAANRDVSLARIRLITVRLADQISSFGRQGGASSTG
ncbi:MAG: hypothetical protein AAFU65_10850, partial [Pseudomonadota bacterium]